nr:site-specific DNA-methyltransferase [Desulfonema magnum]
MDFFHVHYCNENRQNHPTQKPEGLIERMVLASSDEADLIVDPFAGSGTTLRVCQQLKRKCLGIELNPEYVEMIKQRLKKPCLGFDSIDSRMERVPKDLNDKKIREAYLSNHIKWFLGNHNGSVSNFMSTVKKMYGDEPSHSSDNELRQRSLFDS